MAIASEHYENLLADYYSWMCGSAEMKIAENRHFFQSHNVAPELSKNAIDLGAGSGFQSIPLAEAGFQVIAIDQSGKLLNELEQRYKGRNIQTIRDDMLRFSRHAIFPVEMVICMGDTLTHLDSIEQVAGLFSDVYEQLESGGRFILAFRDLTRELADLDRFIPVRSDENTIFTCFLEYENDRVKINDLIYARENGTWTLKKSFYFKLKISMDWAVARLKEIGFEIQFEDIRQGLLTLIVVRPE